MKNIAFVLCLVPIYNFTSQKLTQTLNRENKFKKDPQSDWDTTFNIEHTCISIVEINEKFYVLGYGGIQIKHVTDIAHHQKVSYAHMVSRINLYSTLLGLVIEMESEELPRVSFCELVSSASPLRYEILDSLDYSFYIAFDRDEDTWIYIQKTLDSHGDVSLQQNKKSKKELISNGYLIYNVIEH